MSPRNQLVSDSGDEYFTDSFNQAILGNRKLFTELIVSRK